MIDRPLDSSDWLRGLDLRVLCVALEVDEAESFVDWIEERLDEA